MNNIQTPKPEDKRVILEWAINALVGVINSWNDLQYEPDERGRGDDTLCLELYDDGSGRLGTIWKMLDGFDINPQIKFSNTTELIDFLCEWIDKSEWEDAKPEVTNETPRSS